MARTRLQDASIHFEVKLTGILSTSLASPADGQDPLYGVLVLPRVNAAYHQHLFCARLDFAVDNPTSGEGLVVSEVRCWPACLPACLLADCVSGTTWAQGSIVEGAMVNLALANFDLSRYGKTELPGHTHLVGMQMVCAPQANNFR